MWAIVYLFLDDDPAERAERLLALWPLILIASLLVALWNLKNRPTVARLSPFILIAAVQGAFCRSNYGDPRTPYGRCCDFICRNSG